MSMLAAVNPTATIALQLRPVVELSDDAFIALSVLNPDLRLERSAAGEIVIMSPTGAATSHRNAELTTALHTWAGADGSGQAFDATVGVRLPNGAIRGPDASWIARARLATVPSDERERFLPVCPDFVVELRSPTDDPGELEAKMYEYVANGARLGWLIDPFERQVTVYRPGSPVERLQAPLTVSGDPELPGLVLDLAAIWRPLE